MLNVDPFEARWITLFRTPHASGMIGGISWAGDGNRLAFGATPDGKTFDAFPPPRIYLVGAKGGTVRMVRGTKGGGSPAFSPDGETIAFARLRYRDRLDRPLYASISIWLADARGGGSRQLTPWRNRLFLIPSSFSPDGGSLAAERVAPIAKRPEIVSVSIDSGAVTPLVKAGAEPAYSPDGSAIAFIRSRRTDRSTRLGGNPVFGSDLFIASVDGTQIARVTYTPRRREASPAWDPSGERLAYTQFPAKPTWRAQEGIGSAIVEVNADGTCRHKLLFTYGLSYSEPVWQPGPGRGAGRIMC
jgi:Tol biopolymer transport system component